MTKTTRIQITGGGIFNSKGEEIPVGTILELTKGEPKAWAGRYTVLGGGEGKTAVTNPAPDDLEAKTVEELRELAEKDKIDLQGATKKADIVAAIQLARAPKA